jgi:hypothetical protein
MSCSAYLTDLAASIFNDLGQPTDMSVAYIQSKLTSNAFLGKLNNLTTNCHTIAFTTIQDGDSRITRVSSVDMARLYRDMQKELNAQLNSLTLAYRQSDSLGRSVNYLGIDNTWRGTVGYNSAALEN